MIKKATEQAAAHLALLKLVPGFTAVDIPSDAAKCDELAKAVDAQAKSLPAGNDALLTKLAVEPYPTTFSGARQQILAIRVLSSKAEAKAAVEKLCESIAPKNEATFDINKFNAEFYELKKILFQ